MAYQQHLLRTALALGGLSAGLLAGMSPAHAVVGCRSDPLVILSNGTVLDLSATIGDDVNDITQIHYTLHAPPGTTVARALSTDGPVGYKEIFTVRTDAPAGTYTGQVLVTTQTRGITVTTTIAGGYASALGITPAMVGLISFSGGSSTLRPYAGPPAPAILPSTVTTALSTWIAQAAWAATATSPPGQSGQTVSATIALSQ